MAKLTKSFIENSITRPSSGQTFYRDDEVHGFAIRVTPRSKSYVIERKIDGVTRRITIGRYEDISVEEARAKATCLLAGMGTQARRKSAAKELREISLREVIEKYLLVKRLNESTRRNYQYLVANWLSDWLDLPVVSITKDMVEQRHRDISTAPARNGTHGHSRANAAMTFLKAIINFAAERFGSEEEPLFKINPVERLTQIDAWHPQPRRERVISEHKLRAWYHALATVPNDVFRDYCLFLLLTGLRQYESLALQWSDVDFERKVLTVPGDLTKTGRNHHLPLSDFLCALLMQRYSKRINSDWIFQSAKDRTRHIIEFNYVLPQVRKQWGAEFDLTDLRRTFLSMAEKLNVPHYAIRRLSNCRFGKDITERYLLLDVERLRPYMSRISETFVNLLDVDVTDLGRWKRVLATDLQEWRQLTLPIDLKNENEVV